MIKKSNIRFIDLGLPSKILWGDKNFDNKYYQWGDLQGFSKNQIELGLKTVNWDHYRFNKKSELTKYNDSDNLLELQAEDDIVTQVLGSNYRIPGIKDFNELLEYTEQTYNKNSVIFKSKINGNHIIFPLLGYAYDSSIYNTGSYCDLWSSSLYGNQYFAWLLCVGRDYKTVYMIYGRRCSGCVIRPIYDKEK